MRGRRRPLDIDSSAIRRLLNGTNQECDADMSEDPIGLEPIRDTQRRAIFAAMRARGLTIDDVRSLCPARSISKLSRREAGAVLSRLNAATDYAHPRSAPRGPRRPKGVFRMATPAQRGKVEALRIDLGWTPEALAQWLTERRYADGRPMSRMDSSGDASAVIELLKGVAIRYLRSARRRVSPASVESGS